MTDPVLLIIDALAIFRLSRLITSDTLLDAPRSWLLRRWPGADTEFYDSETERITGDHAAFTAVRSRVYRLSITGRKMQRWIENPVTALDVTPRVWVAVSPHWFGTFISCLWCMSIWVAVAVVAARRWWDWWQWPALVAAGSAAAGWIHSRSQ